MSLGFVFPLWDIRSILVGITNLRPCRPLEALQDSTCRRPNWGLQFQRWWSVNIPPPQCVTMITSSNHKRGVKHHRNDSTHWDSLIMVWCYDFLAVFLALRGLGRGHDQKIRSHFPTKGLVLHSSRGETLVEKCLKSALCSLLEEPCKWNSVFTSHRSPSNIHTDHPPHCQGPDKPWEPFARMLAREPTPENMILDSAFSTVLRWFSNTYSARLYI